MAESLISGFVLTGVGMGATLCPYPPCYFGGRVETAERRSLFVRSDSHANQRVRRRLQPLLPRRPRHRIQVAGHLGHVPRSSAQSHHQPHQILHCGCPGKTRRSRRPRSTTDLSPRFAYHPKSQYPQRSVQTAPNRATTCAPLTRVSGIPGTPYLIRPHVQEPLRRGLRQVLQSHSSFALTWVGATSPICRADNPPDATTHHRCISANTPQPTYSRVYVA